MLYDFDSWSAKQSETHSFAGLKDAIIAIEADFYLGRLLSTKPSQEPLLSALGGLPFSFRHFVGAELDQFAAAGITPIFVFDGLDVGKSYQPFQATDESVQANVKAWDLYEQHHATGAVEAFGSSGAIQPRALYRLFQSLLRERKIDFQVAPYSAIAQLAYLDNFPEYVDIVAASSEIFLYDIEKAIVKLDFVRSTITWVKRRSLIDDYGGTSDKFRDACMLSGSSVLPPLPQLMNPPRKSQRIKMALDMINRAGSTGISVCMAQQDDPLMRRLDYLDRYRRSWMAIKHHAVLKFDGKVEPLDLSNAPSDFYEFIGQRLPDELYYYLSRGVCSPRVLNWLTTQNIYETAPLDGGDAAEYRTLVQTKLTPIRGQSLSLLSRCLTRAYQHRNITLRCWFDPSNETSISLNELNLPTAITTTWNVREPALTGNTHFDSGTPSLKFAISSLSDNSFAAETITPKTSPNALETPTEIGYNTLWRFLHLRGYINDDHTLTPWGKVLEAVQSKLDLTKVKDDVALLAVELLRLDALSARPMYPAYSTIPARGSDADKRNSLIVSRIVTLGTLRHESIGFTGPLSRYLLAYTCMVNAVRSSLRDVLEMSLVTLLLNGDGQRSRDDYSALGLDLPLLHPSDCGLGVAMKSYLDDIAGLPDLPPSTEAKELIKAKGGVEWIPHAINFREDLDRAFEIWDAVVHGVRAAVDLKLTDGLATWEELDAWVAERR